MITNISDFYENPKKCIGIHHDESLETFFEKYFDLYFSDGIPFQEIDVFQYLISEKNIKQYFSRPTPFDIIRKLVLTRISYFIFTDFDETVASIDELDNLKEAIFNCSIPFIIDLFNKFIFTRDWMYKEEILIQSNLASGIEKTEIQSFYYLEDKTQIHEETFVSLIAKSMISKYEEEYHKIKNIVQNIDTKLFYNKVVDSKYDLYEDWLEQFKKL